MNRRLYDPLLGRFLSADPFVQAPSFTQSYNRYSYVLNNPLSLTDPSGYLWGWFESAVTWASNALNSFTSGIGSFFSALLSS